MARTAWPTVLTGDSWSASQHNTYGRDNDLAYWVYTTAGDMAYATSSSVIARLALGAAGAMMYSTGSAPAWLAIGTTYQTMKVNAAANGIEWASFIERCIVFKTATQNVTTATETDLTWDTELSDAKAWHSTVSNTARITVVQDGTYQPFGAVYYTHTGGSGTYQAWGRIKLNGGNTSNILETAQIIDANPKTFCFGGIPIEMTAGQYLTMSLEQNRGATATVQGSSRYFSSFAVMRLA